MKVKELIENLSKLDQEAEVYIDLSDQEEALEIKEVKEEQWHCGTEPYTKVAIRIDEINYSSHN